MGRISVRALCIHGGGYLGLASAAFLEAAERHFSTRCHDRFRVFAGTSTGAIVTLALAKGMSASGVVDLFREMGPKVFPGQSGLPRRLRSAKQWFRSKYDNVELRSALEEAFGESTLGDIRESGRSVIVPAFCLSTGMPRVFKTDHSENLTLHDRYRLVDVALASSAAPTYFPVATVPAPHGEGVEYFCDGGVVANDPSLIAYSECIADLGADPPDIRLLSLSSPRLELRENRKIRVDRGVIGWGIKLPQIAVDGASEITHQTLKRISAQSGAHYERWRLPNRAAEGAAVDALDLVSAESTNVLLSIGGAEASSEEARTKLKRFFLED